MVREMELRSGQLHDLAFGFACHLQLSWTLLCQSPLTPLCAARHPLTSSIVERCCVEAMEGVREVGRKFLFTMLSNCLDGRQIYLTSSPTITPLQDAT
eukprot:2342295-Amphidinium_carterae.2